MSKRKDGIGAMVVTRPSEVEGTPGSSSGSDHPGRRSRILKALAFKNISAAYVLAFFVLIYAIWIPNLFLNWNTVRSVLSDDAITALLAIAIVIPLAAGAFDLSVAATLGLGSALAAYLMGGPYAGLPWPLAVFITLLIGTLIGAVNAGLVVSARVPSMIATLAMSSVLAGAGSAINLNNFLIGLPASFDTIGQTNLLGVATPAWALLVVSLVIWYFLTYTTTGRYVYATGGGAEAARLSGVRTSRIVAGSLIVAGLLAAFTGVVATARVGAGQASIGPPYLLPAFAAAFLGSTQFGNGRFNVWGTVLATYTLSFGEKGLILGGAPVWTPDVFDGVALALAVAFSVRRVRSRLLSRSRSTTAAPAQAQPSLGDVTS